MSKTEKNLEAAFAGESMARNKYTYFAKVAAKEGYIYIAKLFEETADNEMQHAKEHFKLLKGIGDTKANLKAAIEGEHHETNRMYPDFTKEAEDEGEKEAARVFKLVGQVESHHEARYKKLLEMVEKGTVYKRSKPIRWKCSKCGHIHEGLEPPAKCPTCLHAREYFEPECMCFEDDCDKCR
ncbi:MAG: rubrerythrin family protein [Candidatus Aminicenantes bacterium]|nr:rubrerythrin family protein [Candidatus Aminicenantes bacterium]